MRLGSLPEEEIAEGKNRPHQPWSTLLQFTSFPNALQLFCSQGNVRASFRWQRIKTSFIPCKRSCWRNAYSHYGTLGMLSLSGHGFLYDQLVRMKFPLYFVCALVQSRYGCLPRIRAFFVQTSRIANPIFWSDFSCPLSLLPCGLMCYISSKNKCRFISLKNIEKRKAKSVSLSC